MVNAVYTYIHTYIYMYIDTQRAVTSYLPKIGSGGYGLNAIRLEVRILLARQIFLGGQYFCFLIPQILFRVGGRIRNFKQRFINTFANT